MNKKTLIKKTTFIFIALALVMPNWAVSSDAIIAKIKAGNKNVLKSISLTDFEKLHSYKGTDFYIPRKIGQRALRSLFGCFKNKDKEVRFYCAQYLYQLRLHYIHRKLILKLYKKEKYLPAKMALQDVLIIINEERFNKARKMGDSSFLAKVTFSEIAEFIEKGFPEEGDEFTMKDFKFLSGGLKNRDVKMQIFSVQLLGRIKKASGKVSKLLKAFAKKAKGKKLKKEIKTSLKCLKNPKKCPDVELNQYE